MERAYRPDTLVLRTVHHTPQGSVAVTDALAAELGARGHQLGMNSPAVLIRVVEGLSGRVRMALDFAPRPEDGRLTPYLHEQPDGGVVATAGPVVLVLRAGDLPLRAGRDRVTHEFEVSAGEVVGFDVAYGAGVRRPAGPVGPGGHARRDGAGVGGVPGVAPVPRPVPGAGPAQRHRADRPDVHPQRRGRRGADHVAAGAPRRGPQLRLPLLLAARLLDDHAGALGGGLPDGGVPAVRLGDPLDRPGR